MKTLFLTIGELAISGMAGGMIYTVTDSQKPIGTQVMIISWAVGGWAVFSFLMWFAHKEM